MHVLIEDFSILQEYMKCPEYNVKDFFITEDPTVYESLTGIDCEVLSMSSLLSKDEIKEISNCCFLLTKSWIEIVRLYVSKEVSFNIEIDVIINKMVYNLIGTSFYRYSQLVKLKNSGINVTLPYFDVEEHGFTLFNIRKNNLLIQLASLPEFKGNFRLLLLDDSNKKVDKKHEISGGEKVKFWKYYLLAFFAEPSMLTYLLKIPLIKKMKSLNKKKDALHILVSLGTPLVSVQLFRLFLSGVRITFLEEEKIPEHASKSSGNSDELKALLTDETKNGENNMDMSKYLELVGFLADKLCLYVNSYLVTVTKYLNQKIENSVWKGFKNSKVIIFTGTRSASLVSAISNKIYANGGIPTIAFGEGPYCMLKLYRAHTPLGYMQEGEAYVSYDPYEEYYYKEITKKYLKPFYIMGANGILKSSFPKISRILGRKIWNIQRNEVALLYLPTKYHLKSLRTYNEIMAIDYWNFQKRLVFNIFGKSGKDVYLKVLKKGLMSMRDESSNPLNMINLPPNVKFKESPDLRFIRYSADLLIVDLATSTMSWALTSNVPVVYLNMEQSPLEDSVYEDMKKSLFLVDVKENGNWESELLELLQRPILEINKEWENMSPKRDKFIKYYITGYKRGKNDFLNWLRYISDLGVDELRKRNQQQMEVDDSNFLYDKG